MNRSDLAQVADGLRGLESLVICTHVNPDGDALGSMLAMRRFLLGLGARRVACVHDEPAPRLYRWLPDIERIERPDCAGNAFDAAIILDASRKERVGAAAKCIPADKPLFVIDHHLDSAPEGTVKFIDPSYAATGAIITELFDTAGVPLDTEAAVCLYVALATDTGSFRYSNTDSRAHQTAARLVATGIDVQDLSTRLFSAMPRQKFELLRRMLAGAVVNGDGRLAYAQVTADDLRAACAENEDLDNLINILRDIEGVQVAILFKQLDDAATKISFRSRAGFNSAAVCSHFGGGGHAAAAGATVAMPLEQARDAVLREVNRTLETNT